MTFPGWLAVMAACFLYNAWVIPFRYIFFEYKTEQSFYLWFIADYCLMDMLYIVDILVFKHRLLYMENGFWVKVFHYTLHVARFDQKKCYFPGQEETQK